LHEFFARDVPPGVLEPQTGGSIAVLAAKDKKTGPKIARPLSASG
jgi:hypothetical protein